MFPRLHCKNKSYQLQLIGSGKVLALQQPHHDRITKMTWLMFILIFCLFVVARVRCNERGDLTFRIQIPEFIMKL